ncbi:MAG: hypothetical protein ACXWC6_16490 [Ramlibacter sp.]
MRNWKFIAAAVVGAAVNLVGQHAIAQPSLPQFPGTAPPSAELDVGSQVTRMTQRYGLSDDQAAKVRTILAGQAKKADELGRQQLPPEQAIGRLKSLKDEETARVSAVLTPEQRRQYEEDARPTLPTLPTLPPLSSLPASPGQR